MTMLPVDDRAMESALADLALSAPPNLAADVLVELGLADRYATIRSPIGPLYVAWNGRGVSTVGLAADDAAFEAEHQRQTGRRHRATAIPRPLPDGSRGGSPAIAGRTCGSTSAAGRRSNATCC